MSESSMETMLIDTGIVDSTSGESLTYEVTYDPAITDPDSLGITSFSSYDSSTIYESVVSQALSDVGVSVVQQDAVLASLAQEPSSSVSYERLSETLVEAGIPKEQELGILMNVEVSSGFATSLLSDSSDLVLTGDIVSDFLGALGYLWSSPIFVIGISILAAVLSIEIVYSSIQRTVKSDSWVVTDQDTKEMIERVSESLSKYYPMLE